MNKIKKAYYNEREINKGIEEMKREGYRVVSVHGRQRCGCFPGSILLGHVNHRFTVEYTKDDKLIDG